MVTLCSVQDVLDRCGPNANATVIASTAIVERYITVSEGIVIGETRTDWINDFATANSHALTIAKSCVASHSAKQIVAYDGTGMSKGEKADLLNVNQNEFLRTLKALKDLNTQKTRSAQ